MDTCSGHPTNTLFVCCLWCIVVAYFVQVKQSRTALRQRALANIRKAQQADARNPDLDFIALAIEGKKVGFEKVVESSSTVLQIQK